MIEITETLITRAAVDATGTSVVTVHRPDGGTEHRTGRGDAD